MSPPTVSRPRVPPSNQYAVTAAEANASTVAARAGGCGGGNEGAGPTTSASGPTSTRTTTICGEDDAEPVTVTTQDGTELDAALVGDGDVGVVLGHQLGSDM
jgi:hypothetical protein